MISRNMSVAFSCPRGLDLRGKVKDFESVTKAGTGPAVYTLFTSLSTEHAALVSDLGVVEIKHLRNLRTLNCACQLFATRAFVPLLVLGRQDGRELGVFHLQCS